MSIEVIERNLARAEAYFQSISESSSPEELRDAWEDYVETFSKTIGKVISLAINERHTKTWGYRL